MNRAWMLAPVDEGRAIGDAAALLRWIVRAGAGARCVYWSGDLASARRRHNAVAALAREAYRAALGGLVCLVQARRDEENFDYIAVRTDREFA